MCGSATKLMLVGGLLIEQHGCATNRVVYLTMTSSPGDYEGAIDTLRMAITLIKQSVTANSEASQVRMHFDLSHAIILLLYD